MNILIIGAGGREAAYAWKIAQSKLCKHLFIAPGNAGTQTFGRNIDLKPTDFEGIKDFCLANAIDLVLVGPEEPLVKGIHDFFLADAQLQKIDVIGPKQDGAQLEGSKHFSKQFMQRYGIPTAASQTFNKEHLQTGLTYLDQHSLPIVLKADGLAAGKGVLICNTLEEAKREFDEMLMQSKFGNASDMVVVEEFLTGIELSVFVLTDGKNYLVLPEAKDYKRIGEGDTGLNTGGMGSVSPVPFADEAFMQKVEEKIIKPTINGLKTENIDYRGFIFIGLMKVNDEPYVIEYNCRMGDPETESVLPRIENDFVELLQAVANQKLDKVKLNISGKTAATIITVSGGYPGAYTSGKTITGLDNIRDSQVFHAGTIEDDGNIKNVGGRVLAVTCLADNLFDALQKATADASRIYYDGKYFRKDIGFDLL